jgi:putative ABC transport system permease protein
MVTNDEQRHERGLPHGSRSHMSRPGLAFLALQNLRRRPFRAVILVACVAAVCGIEVTTSLLQQAGRAGLALGLERLGADLLVVPNALANPGFDPLAASDGPAGYMDAAVEKRVAALPFVDRTSPQLHVKSLVAASCCSVSGVLVIGFDPETDFTVRPWLGDRKRAVIAGDQAVAGPAVPLAAGASFKLYGRPLEVVATLEPSGSGLDATVFVPLDTVYAMARESVTKAERPLAVGPNQISAVLVRLKPIESGGIAPLRAAVEIEKMVPGTTAILPDDLLSKVHANMTRTLGSVVPAGAVIWPVAVLLCGLTFAMATHERRREIGLLRAMGATRGFIFALIVLEACLVAMAGAALGIASSVGLTAGLLGRMGQALEVPFHWPGLGAVAALALLAAVLALLSAVAAAALPALHASRMEPYEAVRGGGS